MLGQRRRRWSNFKPTLFQCVAFAVSLLVDHVIQPAFQMLSQHCANMAYRLGTINPCIARSRLWSLVLLANLIPVIGNAMSD